ncbi:MAG TPA: amidohydrolase family protein [Actinomycetes bacterium]|nr:amidohydrolase family protein [Actinomycetes bacterium]
MAEFTLLRGGRIYAPGAGGATALVVAGGTVAFAGHDAAALAFCDGAAVRTVDLTGALVTPAFVDAHVHTTSTGLALTGLDVTAAGSLAETLDAIRAHATANRGRPVIGHGWDETRWPERRPPTREELDRASFGGVVYLSRIDVHSAVVSSALFAAAPEIRSAAGYADTGRVSTDAHHLARRVVREALPAAQRTAAQRAALRRAAELGIGAIHELAGPDISSEADLRGLLELSEQEPGPEVIAYWGELGGIERARELGARGAAGDLFADGAIGSHTACLRSVYVDADTSGHRYLTAAQVRDHVVACTETGLQAGFHAIGDAAMEAVVRGCQEAAGVVGAAAMRRVRHRIEHAEMIEPWMVEAMADLGIFASVQPAFDALWGGTDGMYAQRLGVPRALGLNPFAAMAGAGVVLAFGSDSPVTALDPWGTVRAAAHHHVPAQRMSVEAAFAAHTTGGWRAAGDDRSGVLTPGAPATYAIWRADPLHGGTGLPELGVDQPVPTCLATVVHGQAVYDNGVFS